MEINAANLARHKFFVESQNLDGKKKRLSVSCLVENKYKNLRRIPSQCQQKGHKVRNENIHSTVCIH